MSLFYYPYPATAPIVSVPILVEINANMVPIVINALERYKYRQFWASDADYERGYYELCNLEVAIMASTSDITTAIDRLYRLLDTSLNGVVYDLVSEETGVVAPAIPPVPSAFQPVEPASLRSQVARLHQLSENLVTGSELVGEFAMTGASNLDWFGSLQGRIRDLQGEINQGWFGIGGQPATVADLVRTLRVGSDEDRARITDAIDAIADGTDTVNLGEAAAVFNTIKGLFTDVAEVTGEGAILGTLIASSVATSAMLGSLAAKIDGLNTAITALAAILPAVDEVEPRLTEIRDLLA